MSSNRNDTVGEAFGYLLIIIVLISVVLSGCAGSLSSKLYKATLYQNGEMVREWRRIRFPFSCRNKDVRCLLIDAEGRYVNISGDLIVEEESE